MLCLIGHEQKLDVCEQEISEENGEVEEGEEEEGGEEVGGEKEGEEEAGREKEGVPTLASRESQEEMSIFKLKMKCFPGPTAAGLRIRAEPSLAVRSVYLWTCFSGCHIYCSPLSSMAG